MSKKPLTISEEAAVQMPMKTVASLIVIVALGTMGYFQIVERLNHSRHSNTINGKRFSKKTQSLELNGHVDNWVHCPPILSNS